MRTIKLHYDDIDFDYEVDKVKIVNLLEDMLKVDSWFIEDTFDELFEEYKEQILAHYEDEARQVYEDATTDIYKLYGHSRSDFK